ncbi:MAG: nitrogen regulation protein NR(II) [Planctomycetota bacterium]
MSFDRIQILERQLERSRRENAALERMIESKTRSMFGAQQRLTESARHLRSIMAAMPSAMFVIATDGRIQSSNEAAARLSGYATEPLEGRQLAELLPGIDVNVIKPPCRDIETSLMAQGGEHVPVLCSLSYLSLSKDSSGMVCVAHDLRDKKQLELELRHAQKLESVGQLAAGIAHEINTPIQFVSNNAEFVRDSIQELATVLMAYAQLHEAAQADRSFQTEAQRIARVMTNIDLPFLLRELPSASERTIEGTRRVAAIVRAMKSFAHPGDTEKAPHDLNEAIHSTLEVCRHEYRYVARVDLDLQPLPDTHCNLGDVNQVLLNLIVNAAHAIKDKRGDSSELGVIRIHTEANESQVLIEIGDDGNGIPTDVQRRIFDPFFTTKEVGRGSGQGLAISRNLIVERHGGRISFESKPGAGSTFRVELPITPSSKPTSTPKPTAQPA